MVRVRKYVNGVEVPTGWVCNVSHVRTRNLHVYTAPGGEIVYVRGGRNGGVSYVTVKTPAGWAYSPGRWPKAIRRVFILPAEPETLRLNLRAALNRVVPEERIIHVQALGFTPGEEERWYHPSGWYTRFPWALEVIAPRWAGPEAKAYTFAEGEYIAFGEGTYRFIPANAPEPEWPQEELLECHEVAARQGDLLIYKHPMLYEWNLPSVEETALERVLYERHTVEGKYAMAETHGVFRSEITISHPEHETLVLPEPGPEHVWIPVLAPGTSQPFTDGGRD